NRGKIEKAFDVLQNLLETDRPYISSEDVFREYLFASFISLAIYYIVLNFLQEHEVNNSSGSFPPPVSSPNFRI
ncbi:hypothetical protein AKJ41_03870, partial [candidate division MSBL1 archaeon SCGC-AAA259O05]